MEENFKLEIISPEKRIFSGDIKMVVIPSYEGDMSILKNHISIITFLRPGIVKAQTNENNFSQFFVAEVFTGSPGKLVDLEATIKGFDAICKGEYDHLPEAAFYMVGTIEEAVEKAEKMAKEAAA